VTELSSEDPVRAGFRRGTEPALRPLPFAVDGQFHTRRSGLLAPVSSTSQPIDLIQPFATGTELIGQLTPIPVVRELLARRSLTHALAFCGHWLAADEPAEDTAAVDREYVETYFADPGLVARAKRLIRRRHRILFPQALLALAKAALLFCPERQPAGEPDTEEPLVAALMGISDYLGARNELAAFGAPWGALPSKLSLEFVANQYFNAVYDQRAQLARFRRIYQQLMAGLVAREPQKYLDFDSEFLRANGLPVSSVITVAMAAWAHANALGPMIGLGYFDSLTLPRDEVKAVLELLSTDQATAAKQVTEDERAFGFAWTFSVFGQHPLIRVGADAYIVVSPQLLANRVFGGLIYWDVAHRLNSQSKSRLDRLRGDAVQAYVEEVLHAIAPPLGGQQRVYSEQELQRAFNISRKGSQKICDAVVDYGDAFVLVEVTSRRLTRESAAGASTTAVDDDIAKLIVKKARQLDATIEALRQRESALTGRPASANRRYHPVVVTDDQFPNSPVTRDRVQELLVAEGLLQGAGVTQLEVISLEDIDVLEGVVEHGGPTVAEILAGKSEGTLRAMDLLSYLLVEEQMQIEHSARVTRLLHELLDDGLRTVNAAGAPAP